MLQDKITAGIREFFGDPGLAVSYNVPPSKEMGDFSTAVCMPFAKTLRKAPFLIAEELAEHLTRCSLPYIASVEVTKPGYVNFRVDHPLYARDLIGQILEEGDRFGDREPTGRNILVEHTNVNPNKAMHIGHLRNAIIGDSVVRILRRMGHRVQACNYIDDTGVQVADVVVAMLYLDEPVYDGSNIDAIWKKAEGSQSFDYWCWDVYSRISAAYESDPELKEKRVEVLHMVESQDNPIAAFAKEVAAVFESADIAGYNSNHFDIPLLGEEMLRAGVEFDIMNRKMIDVFTIFTRKEQRTLSAAYAFYCGKTLDDAITEACQKLTVTSDKLDYEVVEKGTGTFILKQ